MRPPSPTGLYWSIRGEVACEAHAPATDDARWTIWGWAPIPVSSGKVRGARYRCQHCRTDGRAVVHPPNNNAPH
jgi:hypothetical protein